MYRASPYNCSFAGNLEAAGPGFEPGLRASVNRSWSPNGKKIAFSLFVRRNKTGGQIFTMNADGSNQKNLTKQTHSSSPAWSPDGKKIVFLRDDIYVMKSDGTKVKRLV